jgi:hypothetical protein
MIGSCSVAAQLVASEQVFSSTEYYGYSLNRTVSPPGPLTRKGTPVPVLISGYESSIVTSSAACLVRTKSINRWTESRPQYARPWRPARPQLPPDSETVDALTDTFQTPASLSSKNSVLHTRQEPVHLKRNALDYGCGGSDTSQWQPPEDSSGMTE